MPKGANRSMQSVFLAAALAAAVALGLSLSACDGGGSDKPGNSATGPDSPAPGGKGPKAGNGDAPGGVDNGGGPAAPELDLSGLPEVPLPPRREGDAKVTMLFSTGVDGELVDCGCPSHPRGGLARRAHWVQKLRESGKKAAYFEGGNGFFPTRGNRTEASDELKDRSIILAKALALMEVEAVNVGAIDLRGGLDHLVNDIGKADPERPLPLISANLVKSDTKERVFPPFKVIKAGGVQIGVFGVMEQAAFPGADIEVTDPAESCRLMVAALKDRCDIVVGLYAMNISTASRLIREIKGVDVVIASDRTSGVRARPLILGDSMLFQAGNRGMYIGRIELTFPAGAKEEMSKEEHGRIRSEIERLEAQRNILVGTIQRDPGIRAKAREVENKIDELTKTLSEAGAGFKYESSVVSVDLEWPEDEKVAEWVKAAGVEARTKTK